MGSRAQKGRAESWPLGVVSGPGKRRFDEQKRKNSSDPFGKGQASGLLVRRIQEGGMCQPAGVESKSVVSPDVPAGLLL